MNIYDCFMYFDEDLLLDLRLNVLNNFVKKFVITEATYTHNGSKKKLQFDINKFKKFEDKIIYIIVDQHPENILKLSDGDSKNRRAEKLILNGMARDYFQRENLDKGLNAAHEDDLILISDLDEIPNLEVVDLSKIHNNIAIFEQKMFYYKFNLLYENYTWQGTKAVKKKNFISPQWLRNVKGRKYPLWRIDTFFSKTKYMNIRIINNGGWHFTNLKNANEIEYKLKSYLHHREFDVNPISSEEIKKIMNDKIAIYDLSLDKKTQKIGHGKKLQKYSLEKLPKFLQNNIVKYQEWID